MLQRQAPQRTVSFQLAGFAAEQQLTDQPRDACHIVQLPGTERTRPSPSNTSRLVATLSMRRNTSRSTVAQERVVVAGEVVQLAQRIRAAALKHARSDRERTRHS